MTSGGLGRKPRIALMGEFSAGKSTLSNLLMGVRPLPEKVTATRLSPVWITFGDADPYRVDLHGNREPIEIAKLEEVPVEETRYVHLSIEADILEVCDLIDFPGISDPNMSSDVWERMLTEVDAVIWCTHANQAWRQSEAAVWETMPQAVKENSTLLITRYDKLTTERDRVRVFKRVARETRGMFGGTFPISLLMAIRAGEDQDLWDASGAGPFTEHLIDTIEKLTELTARSEVPLYNYADPADIPEPVVTPVIPRRVQRRTERPTALDEGQDHESERVVPARPMRRS
ncbi:dynamin family protein [Yoonia litorea]|uniref:Dynamin family protein n=1 Tax=Yoonia litorea TaxID=1123755 RepID=A0A1I6N2R4_9RHOB|nr:dynamin family protein [Yoonia litorea]SFS22226.1 Dynamin family protein [Yoonia litorea]